MSFPFEHTSAREMSSRAVGVLKRYDGMIKQVGKAQLGLLASGGAESLRNGARASTLLVPGLCEYHREVPPTGVRRVARLNLAFPKRMSS